MADGQWMDEIDIPRMDTPQDVAASILDDIVALRRHPDGTRFWTPRPLPRRPYGLRSDPDIGGLIEAWRAGENVDDASKTQIREWREWRHECARVRSDNEATLFTLLGTLARLRTAGDETSLEIAREISRVVLQGPWQMTAAQAKESTEPGVARQAAKGYKGNYGVHS